MLGFFFLLLPFGNLFLFIVVDLLKHAVTSSTSREAASVVGTSAESSDEVTAWLQHLIISDALQKSF